MPSAPPNYEINDIRWYGIIFQNYNTADMTCPIVLSYGTASVTPSALVNYGASYTPYVTSLNPLNGTILGGTHLVITGSGFGTVMNQATVTIDNVPCVITSISNTNIACTTGPRPIYTPTSFEIFIINKGYAALRGLYYLYADLWSSDTTWGGEVPPRDGESVTIPAGLNIILDVPTGVLNLLEIEGTLIVQDSPGITIEAFYIFIFGGTLQIGTEDNHYTNKITVTIHGTRSSPALPNYGNKFIAVRTGLLDIHGSPKRPSWTTLAQTASPGAGTITLSESVNWQVGDSIVIASTSYEYNETEVKTITQINGNVINIDTPLVYKHYANTDMLGTGGKDSIDMRAEVGVLTRNVRIKGSDDTVEDEFGVHIMLYSPGDETSVGRIENLELFQAGQAYSLGRYPLHFHLIGKVSESYVRNNSIHDTFNRACTIHGVFYFRVMYNVAYNVKGHTYFIEDGIEIQNRIEGNLGLCTHPSYSLLNTDQAPATFWVTNPNNFFRNNHAAGGSNYGFWFSMEPNPTGPSATTLACPQSMQLGAFENNTSHTYGKYGLRIFIRFMPVEFPCDPISDSNTFIPTIFYNHVSWKCKRNGAIAEQVGDIRFNGFKVADNILGGIEFTYTGYSPLYTTTRITNAVIVGNTLNTEGLSSGSKGIVTPQTDGLLIENVRIYNFDSTQFMLADESHSVQCPVFDSGGRLVKISGLTVDSSSVKFINWGNPNRGIFQITDQNSILPQNTHIAAFWPHLLTPSCTYHTEYNAVICLGETIRRVTLYGNNPAYLLTYNLNALRITGASPPVTYEMINGTNTSVPYWSSGFPGKGQNNHRIGHSHAFSFVTGYTY